MSEKPTYRIATGILLVGMILGSFLVLLIQVILHATGLR